MFSVLNVNTHNTVWDNTGIVIFYPHRQVNRLMHRVGSLALLYEPTHVPHPRGYFAAGLGASGRAGMQIRDVSKEDLLGIVMLGLGDVERIPYALM